MSDGLDVIIVDDDKEVCYVLEEIIREFYTWGKVYTFHDADEAIKFCLNREVGIGIFVIDVFLDGKSGFYLLDAIENKYCTAYEDTIIITGNASDDVVHMCVASGVTHLLEKPVKVFALQLAVRSIVAKYINFYKKLLDDPAYAENVAKI